MDDPRPSYEALLAEHVDRLLDGQQVDPGAIRAAHPELAERLLKDLESFIDPVAAAVKPVEAPLGVVGDYRLLRPIGRGGMGLVYEAWQGSMDRRVALKVLPPGIAADPRTATRFLREAQIAGKLQHPNVVSVFGMGVEGGTPYYSMERIDGETLAARLKRERLESLDEARCRSLAATFACVADGLQHAHEQKVIHRDLKPSNLMFDRASAGEPERLRILDFGLARLEGQEAITLSGDVLGTPQYMSPEQAQRKQIPVDHRTDIYSLGATLYEALTLRPPFVGEDAQDTLSRIIALDPEPPRRINSQVSPDLETIVLKCLRKEAADRYGTAEALAQDLRRFLRGEVIEARPLTRWERLSRRAQRHWGKLTAGAVAAVLLLVSAGLGYRVHQEERRLQAREYDRAVAAAAMKVLRGELVLTAGPADGSTGDFFLTTEYRDLLAPGVRRTLGEALIELATSIARFPDRVVARHFRARALWLLGRNDEALREVEAALGVDASFAPARALRATLDGELDARLDEIVGAHERTPTEATVWGAAWARALRRARRGNWEKATASYGELIALDGPSEAYPGAAVEHLLRRGIAHLYSGRPIEAALDFQAAQTRARVDWGEFLEPGLWLGFALRQIPAEPVADAVLAHLLTGAGGLDPDEVSLWVAGLHATAVESAWLKPDEQLPEARKVIQIRPRDRMSYVVLGRALVAATWCQERGLLKEPAGSLEELHAQLARTARKALELGPEDVGVAGFWSQALEAEGKYAEAEQTARRSFALDRRLRAEAASAKGAPWQSPPRPAPGSQWDGSECEDGYFEVLGRIMDAGVNSPCGNEWGLGVSADGLQLFYSSFRPGTAGAHDIYCASWDARQGAFGSVRRLAGASTEHRDASPSLSGDGQSLYLQLFRPTPPYTYYGKSTWDPEKQDFGPIEEWPDFRAVGEGGYMGPCSVAFDELELFFSAKEEYGNAGDQDLYVAWRSSPGERFTRDRCRRLVEIDSPFDDVCPMASRDGKTVFWSGFLSDSHAGSHGRELVRSSVWLATRPRRWNPETGEPEKFRDIRWVRLEPEVPAVHFRVTGDWPAEGARAYFSSALPRGGSVRDEFDIYTAVWRRKR